MEVRGIRAERADGGLLLPMPAGAHALSIRGQLGTAQQAAAAPGWARFTPRLGSALLVPTDGTSPFETRRCTQLTLPGSQLHMFHESQDSRGTPPDPGEDEAVAPSTQEERGDPEPTSQPLRSPLRADASAPHRSTSLRQRGTSVERGDPILPDHGGHAGPRPPMGSQAEAIDPHSGQGATMHGDSPNAGTIEAAVCSRGGGAETTCSSEHEQPNLQCATMEAPGELETWSVAATTPGQPADERHLAVHSVPHETMEPATQHLGTIDPEELAEGLYRENIMAAILLLKLVNERNQCWMNANVMAWLWCITQARDMKWGDYGTGANEVSALLTQNPARGINLLDWGLNPSNWDAQHQQDSAEYTTDLLTHFAPPRVDMHWEKRVMVGARGEVLETNESRTPVLLRLGDHPTSFQQLLDCWCADENSVAGFLHDSAFKVFQLDRVSYDDRGHPKKLDTPLQVESQVHLPCFVDERDTAYELVAYDVVAVVYHLQAGLRAGPPTQWHSTDDGRMATYHPTLLKAVAKNLVQIWVVKHDVMGTSNPRPPLNTFMTQVHQIALLMQDKDYTTIYRDPAMRELLGTRCVLCGQWVFRYRDAMQRQSQLEALRGTS